MENKDVLILAIESSCDETAAAVVKNGRTVLSSVIFTRFTAVLGRKLLPENILKILSR